jgi:hypothetical protein
LQIMLGINFMMNLTQRLKKQNFNPTIN